MLVLLLLLLLWFDGVGTAMILGWYY
jgi:magnesium-transporting ATPase (P-type)